MLALSNKAHTDAGADADDVGGHSPLAGSQPYP
jgi:hypothetical protein